METGKLRLLARHFGYFKRHAPNESANECSLTPYHGVLLQPGNLLTKATNPTIMKTIAKIRQTDEKYWNTALPFNVSLFRKIRRHKMKTAGTANRVTTAGTCLLCAAALGVVLISRLAIAQTAPAIAIVTSGTNEVTLTVTNGFPTNIYEIYWTEFLDTSSASFTNGDWLLVYSGTVGQTNFVLDLSDTDTGFFRGLNGNDFDNDGALYFQDARPFDPSIGLMRVTIESPSNGSNVQ